MGKVFSLFINAIPNALEGAARILDFGNHMAEYNTTSGEPTDADRRAFAQDWYVLGQDMRSSIRKVAGEIEGQRVQKQ
jgi:hypothetical protein